MKYPFFKFVFTPSLNSKYDFEKADFKWFQGGELNITENVLDRHLEKSGNKTALIWEPNNPLEESRIITYRQLHSKVCQFANVLKKFFTDGS